MKRVFVFLTITAVLILTACGIESEHDYDCNHDVCDQQEPDASENYDNQDKLDCQGEPACQSEPDYQDRPDYQNEPDEPTANINIITTTSTGYLDDSGISPIMRLFGWRNAGQIVGGVKDSELLGLEELLFGSDNVGGVNVLMWEHGEIEIGLIKTGDVVQIFDREGNRDVATVQLVGYAGAFYNYVLYTSFADFGNLSMPFFGIVCDWDPLPRLPEYSENMIRVDIDGDGVVDTISWETIEIERSAATGYEWIKYHLIITADYNGTISTTTIEYWNIYQPLWPRIGVFDITGTGTMELVVDKGDVMGHSISIYAIDEDGLTEMLNFVFHSGP
jgi:hypothetical protein